MRPYEQCHNVEGVDVDEKAVEELEFHRDTIARDANSPLHLIREKELEISARLLTAKREADSIVSEARKRAAAIAAAAQGEAVALAEEKDRAMVAQVERDAEGVKANTDADVAALEESIAQRRRDAVDYILESVLKV